jgi:exoribonuclease-2
MGRVRMSTTPSPHEGLGVARYAWCTSPLRRYVDLFNQRQLMAAALDQSAPYQKGDADVFAIVSSFEAAYGQYAEFQERMERYWSLRWLQQENATTLTAGVARGDILRVDGLPMTVRLAAADGMPRGKRAVLDVVGMDDVDLSIEVRLSRWIDDVSSGEGAEDDDPGGDVLVPEANGS